MVNISDVNGGQRQGYGVWLGRNGFIDGTYMQWEAEEGPMTMRRTAEGELEGEN